MPFLDRLWRVRFRDLCTYIYQSKWVSLLPSFLILPPCFMLLVDAPCMVKIYNHDNWTLTFWWRSSCPASGHSSSSSSSSSCCCCCCCWRRITVHIHRRISLSSFTSRRLWIDRDSTILWSKKKKPSFLTTDVEKSDHRQIIYPLATWIRSTFSSTTLNCF